MSNRERVVEVVLGRLPSGVREKMKQFNFHIFCPGYEVAGSYCEFGITQNEGGMPTAKVIYLSPLLEKKLIPDSLIEATLLHEIAHWYLNHRHVENINQEHEAWNLIKGWGFNEAYEQFWSYRKREKQ